MRSQCRESDAATKQVTVERATTTNHQQPTDAHSHPTAMRTHVSVFVIFGSDSKIFARFTLIYALINENNARAAEGERDK